MTTDVVSNVLLATESCLPDILRGKKSNHFPELLPLKEQKDSVADLCFGFDCWCFLFSSVSHFLGKPAVSISDIHMSRSPWSI